MPQRCALGAFAREQIFDTLHAKKLMFTVIDNETGVEADIYAIKNEVWAQMHRVEDFALCPDGILLLVDAALNAAYCPAGRFTIQWHKHPAATFSSAS